MKSISLIFGLAGLCLLLFVDSFKSPIHYPKHVVKAFKEIEKKLAIHNAVDHFISMEIKPATPDLVQKFPPEMILLNEKAHRHLVLQIIDLANEKSPHYMGQISILDKDNNLKEEVNFYF